MQNKLTNSLSNSRPYNLMKFLNMNDANDVITKATLRYILTTFVRRCLAPGLNIEILCNTFRCIIMV